MVAELLKQRNPDGGWGYRPGQSSWTEPTAYAALALPGAPAIDWLLKHQTPDGAWTPHPSVSQPTYVTAIAALVPGLPRDAQDRAVNWLLAQKGRSGLTRPGLLNRLFGAPDVSEEFPGWSFVPGTATWTVPTALGILALARAARHRSDVLPRLRDARAFLESRACSDGGWNYGPPSTLDVPAPSYPESTGIALLALAGVQSPRIDKAIAYAAAALPQARSADAAAWLTLALRAHKRPVPAAPSPRPRTTVDQALTLLAQKGISL